MSEATCCPLSSGDGPAPSFIDDELRRARKEHRCSECHQTIGRGEKYESATGMWDGRINTFKTCLTCVEIRQHFGCGGWVYGQVWSDLADNFFPDMRAGGPCMEGLSPEARQRLIDERMEWYLDQGEIDDSQWKGWRPPAVTP